MDNVFIERLLRSLKYKDVYLKGYAGGREAKAGIAAWMEFYNGHRLHQAPGYRTPDMDDLLSCLGLEVGIEPSDKLGNKPIETLKVSDEAVPAGSTLLGQRVRIGAKKPRHNCKRSFGLHLDGGRAGSGMRRSGGIDRLH